MSQIVMMITQKVVILSCTSAAVTLSPTTYPHIHPLLKINHICYYSCTVEIFKGKRKRNVVDIDGPQFRSDGYDPSYGWSIWTNERKLEVKEASFEECALRRKEYMVLWLYDVVILYELDGQMVSMLVDCYYITHIHSLRHHVRYRNTVKVRQQGINDNDSKAAMHID